MEVDRRAMERTPAKDIGYNTAAIHNLIRKAFTVEELRRFCRDRPALRPVCDEFAPAHGLNDLADEVIAYCQAHLAWEDLLAAIAQEHPRQYARFEPMLRGPEYATPLPTTERIGQGLVALAELMQMREVRTAVVTFHADFRAARDQIGLLSDYKYLHDLLHELQFHCYTPILQAARRFPDDDLAAEDLEYYDLTFQRIVDDLEEAATGATFGEVETMWVADLAESRQALRASIESLDAQQLKRALWLLNRVLAVQPSRINTRLNAAARAIRLPALVEAITCVSDNVIDLELDPAKVGQFQAGMQALTHLLHGLTALVDEHDRWQVVDLELRRIEATMGQDIFELEMSWPDLQEMTVPLYSSSAEDWALSFQQDAENLESALAATNPARIKRVFRCYRRRAGTRFHDVDLDLKKLCEDLNRVGEPLDLVMRMIE